MDQHEKHERLTTHRKKQKSRRIHKSRRRVLLLKAPVVIQMRPSRFGFLMEACAVTNKTGTKFQHLPILPVCINVLRSTKTSLHSISRSVGSTRKRNWIYQRISISCPTPTSSEATAAARSLTRTTNSSASFSTAISNPSFSTAFSPTNKPEPSRSILQQSSKRCAKF